jgi:nucleoside-diphosphate-sugar epimerase
VALSHVDDVTAMIALAIGNAKSHKQIFNCGTDRFISYKTLCVAISKACKQVDGPKFAFYDPKKLNIKPSFPFRASTFVLDPSKVYVLFIL